MIAFTTFQTLAAQYNVIPLIREILADCVTPISLASRLKKRGSFYLLESVEGSETWGRYSILGFNIRSEFSIVGDQALLTVNGQQTSLPGNPIDALQRYLHRFQIARLPGVPRFVGGAVGYLSFEAVRFFERAPNLRHGDGGFPDGYFMISDEMAVFDNRNKTVMLICCVHPEQHPDLSTAYAHGSAALTRIEAELFSEERSTILPGPQPIVNQETATSSQFAQGRSPSADGRFLGGLDRERVLTPTFSPKAKPDANHPQPTRKSPIQMNSNMSRAAYEEMVRQAKLYIYDGDIIQVVLAQHFTTPVTADSLDIYRALRYVNPSPYLYFLHLSGGRSIAGSSPEVMVRVTGDKAEIRPIAGTRPRGDSEAADAALGAELAADPKERAEHVMLVDLARNDLGRIAKPGTVEVKDFMFIERYSHVMHLVSQVEGRVRQGLDAIDVLKASFPAGTLTGAPKVRAMEIIGELEPIRRGPYGGAIGYIGYGCENMDLAITIRTVVIADSQATVTAGAGVVYDSVPENEYMETIHKSNGMRRALELAENGLDLENAP